MDIVVEKGNVDVGNTAEPSYEVVSRSGCSAQLSTNDTDEHELESEDSKVSVGNAAKQSHDVVGVGIDCIFNHVKVSTEADLGPQPDVIHLTSLDVPNESSQICSDADMVKQNQQDALDTLIRISQHKKPKKLNVARVVSEDYKCTPEDVQLIEYIKTLPGKQVVVNIDSAWLNRNDMECLFHGDMQLSDKALNAYIHCIRGEEHLLHREGGKVFLENTFISSLLKRDGDPKVLLNCVPSNEYRRFSLVPGSSECKKKYDGDSTIGHRLYTEDVTVNFKHNWMGKGGRLTKPVTNIYWETVATNLDEFLEISEKLSRKGRAESINSGCHAASDCEWSSCGRRSAITVAKKEPARPSGAPAPLDAGDSDRWMPRRE
uniref:Uncharacterized protein n=1 Tax=Zea mays TaxID=4577 RepID=A0A804R6M6_MAIZE